MLPALLERRQALNRVPPAEEQIRRNYLTPPYRVKLNEAV
jgi:hypothetical protein